MNDPEDEDDNPVTQLVDITESITTDTTWTTGTNYRVTGYLSVSADLTIEPGVRVEFVEAAGLQFRDGSRLQANGTSSAPIVMTGTQQNRGHWRGLAFSPNTIRHTINAVEFTYGGNGQGYSGIAEASTIALDRDSKVEFTNSTISESGSYGLYGDAKSSDLTGFSNNTFGPSDNAPVYISFVQAGTMDAGSTFRDEESDAPAYVRLYGDRMTSTTTVTALDVPYRVAQQELALVDGEVTFGAGVHMEFEEAAGLRVDGDADFAISGTSSNGVLLTGVQKTAGAWNGIVFYPNTVQHEVNYTTIEYGGRSVYSGLSHAANIQLDRDVHVQLTNSTVRHSAAYGLYTDGESSRLPGFAANTFAQNAEAPMFIAPTQIGALDEGSAFSDNAKPHILVYEGGSSRDATVVALQNDVPYRLQAAATARFSGRLTINDGAEFEFEEAAALRFNDGSKLEANGTSSDGILMTSANSSPTKGDWNGIVFYPNTIRHSMSYVTVEFGGRSEFSGTGGTGNVVLDRDTSLDLFDSTITDSAGHGAYLDASSAQLDDTGTTYDRNTNGNRNM